MKKCIAIFLLLIYSITNVGATVNMHYCMDELMGSSFFHSTNDKCPKCGMKKAKAKGCCKDEEKQIKIEQEHAVAKQIKMLQQLPIVALPAFFAYHFDQPKYNLQLVNCKPNIPPPPLISTVKQHVLCCVFLI